jgi:hypothetical protein
MTVIILLIGVLFACRNSREEQDAGSRQNLALPRLLHHGNLQGEKGIWEDE